MLFFLGAWNIRFAKVSLDLVIEKSIDELSIIKVDMLIGKNWKNRHSQTDSLYPQPSTSARARCAV